MAPLLVADATRPPFGTAGPPDDFCNSADMIAKMPVNRAPPHPLSSVVRPSATSNSLTAGTSIAAIVKP
jgi:hypothetical protein